MGVVWPGLGHAAHAVVAVTQQLDPQTVMFIGEFVKSGHGCIHNYCLIIVSCGARWIRWMMIISNFTREYLAKSSLRRRINSSAVQVADNWVNPQISAKRILKKYGQMYFVKKAV